MKRYFRIILANFVSIIIAAGLQKVAIIKNTESSFMSNCTKELYSGTSHNGPSQKRTTSLERTNAKAPIDFSMQLM